MICRSYWRRQWHPTPVLLPGKSHGRRSLVGCGPWGRYESGTTERLHFHFSLSCVGESNGNPLQCSWLDNPRDGGAWWASVCGVVQSWTRLKWLSSSSSSSRKVCQSQQALPSLKPKIKVRKWEQDSSVPLSLCCSQKASDSQYTAKHHSFIYSIIFAILCVIKSVWIVAITHLFIFKAHSGLC